MFPCVKKTKQDERQDYQQKKGDRETEKCTQKANRDFLWKNLTD